MAWDHEVAGSSPATLIGDRMLSESYNSNRLIRGKEDVNTEKTVYEIQPRRIDRYDPEIRGIVGGGR